MMADVLTRELDTDEMPTAKRTALPSRPEVIDDAGRAASMTVLVRAPRIAVCLLVSFEIDASFYVGLTENLSEGGVFVATRAVQSVGARIDLGIMIPEEEPLRARGSVVWQRPSGQGKGGMPGMGIRFDGLPPHERARIRDLAQTQDATLEEMDWEIDRLFDRAEP